MAVIALEGMHFFAFHGYYDEEQKMGGDFILDVYVTTSIADNSVADNLETTINYESLYFICRTEMKKPAKLIETVANRIGRKIKTLHPTRVSMVKVRLRKLNPPLGGKVDCAYVEIEVGSTDANALNIANLLAGK
ncbi:MAG: dihydroneopterin aldolase [Saprospiraceae bacterium]|nr:dihydroneopterin aldolase [Saprospiraceae bacterium]